ncbi:MAG: hypothetical protein ACRC1P_04260 [Cellulosilyticaceae bacterium]
MEDRECRYQSWMLIREKLEATIGQDEEVCVHYLERVDCDSYCIRISVSGRAKAEALRKLIPLEYKYGNITVRTLVEEHCCEIKECYCPTNAKQIANTVCIALQGNYLFEAVALPNESKCILPSVYVLIIPKCIRLWGPEGYVSFEEHADNLFAEVLRTSYGTLIRVKMIFTNRYKSEINACDIYCVNR